MAELDTKKMYDELNDVWKFIKANKHITEESIIQARNEVFDKFKAGSSRFAPMLFDAAYAIMFDAVKGINDYYVVKEE